MTMTNLRRQMIEDMNLNGLSPGTQQIYVEAIRALARHYKQPPDQLSQQQVKQYLGYLKNTRKLAKSTLGIRICAIRFLYGKTLQRHWSILNLARVKTERKLPVVLSRDEVWELLDKIQTPKARMSLMLMYTCGLRVSEATGLRVRDVDSRRMVIIVRNTKNNKDRLVPLPKQTLQELRQYWSKYRPKEWLFPNKHGNGPISNKWVRLCMKAAQMQTSIRKTISCHALRHSYATHLLEEGLHLRAIQALLGHRSLRTTFIYLHLSQSAMADVQARINRLMRQ
jgi:site-specific recombinase XerD